MPDTARVNFNVKNFTSGVSIPSADIYYVLGITKRGPVEQPESDVSLIDSWPKFVRYFGGLMETSDFPLLCYRALKRGARLRVCRVNAVSTAAVKASAKTFANGDGTPVNLFSAQPKYKGADYNKVSIEIKAASNGDDNYWDMSITHSDDSSLNEYYANISAFNADTADNQTCLNDVKNQSQLLDFTYLDASSATLLIPDTAAASAFSGGVDPAGHVASDYSAALTTFDEVDDGIIMAVPEIDDDALNAAGASYAAGRKDLVFFAHLPNSLTTAVDIKAERETVASNTKFVGFFGGGIKFRHPETLLEKSTSEMGDVLGIAAYVAKTYFPWYSLAGQSKGSVPDAMGVVNNFGTPAKFSDLNTLANAQVNMMVKRDNIVQLSGNFSGQYENNAEKFMNVVFLVLFIRKTVVPILNEYLEEPNDPVTFKAIFNRLQPFFEDLKSPRYRAIYEYEYNGDQFAKSLDELQVNNPTDVQNGKYTINLKIWAIPSLQELDFNLMLVQGEGVTVE